MALTQNPDSFSSICYSRKSFQAFTAACYPTYNFTIGLHQLETSCKWDPVATTTAAATNTNTNSTATLILHQCTDSFTNLSKVLIESKKQGSLKLDFCGPAVPIALQQFSTACVPAGLDLNSGIEAARSTCKFLDVVPYIVVGVFVLIVGCGVCMWRKQSVK
ncbi:hypothetical protein BDR26DRAFT_854165, partial [Obelidium mucronatum]